MFSLPFYAILYVHKEAYYMKRFVLFLTLMLSFSLSCTSGLASMPPMAEDMLPASSFSFDKNQKYPVYQGPGEHYGVAANGKAYVSTNGDIQVFGYDRDYLLIRYNISESRSRVGYISAADFDWEPVYQTGWLHHLWRYGRAQAVHETFLTDDPFHSDTPIASITAGEQVITLYAMQDYVYVETLSDEPLRGFIPANALTHLPVEYDDNADLVAAVNQLHETGIEFQVTGRYHDLQEHLYVTPANGGRMYYLDVFDFYPYDLRAWYVTDELSDEDLGKWMDHFLRVACTVEDGSAPEEHLKYGYMDDLGDRNIEAVVSNILLDMESFGQQGLDVLLAKLSLHDGNDALNSMRARAASRILGKLDRTAVSPEEGCAWYDALTLSVQNDLPPANASLYVTDPLLCAATQLLLDYNQQHNSWGSRMDVDGEKCVNIVSLHAEKIKESSSAATVWGVEWYSKYALYDSVRAYNVSGHVVPLRMDMEKDADGAWTLKKITYAQDGTLYAPSILDLCDGRKTLANKLMALPGEGTDQSFLTYLAHHGYTGVTVE